MRLKEVQEENDQCETYWSDGKVHAGNRIEGR